MVGVGHRKYVVVGEPDLGLFGHRYRDNRGQCKRELL
jgi:hypothetical protein